MTMLQYAQANKYQAAEGSILYVPSRAGSLLYPKKKALIAIHGRNGSAANTSYSKGWHNHIRKLVDAGYIVFSIDCGAQVGGAGTTDANSYKNQWGNDAAMTAITNAKDYLLTNLGASGSTKVGFMDHSLGGGQGFNWMTRNPNLASGVISYAPACDYDYFYNNDPQPGITGCKSELELSYTSTKSTTTGSGTLNQVGSNLTIAGAMGLPASGTLVLYAFGQQAAYALAPPVIVTYTGGGGTTTLTGCTIPANRGSIAWGTGTSYLGVCTVGGYATNKNTRSPLLIASNVVFDAVPVHCYVGTVDEFVGASATPASTQVPDFVTAVNAAPGQTTNAVYHSVAGKDHSGVFDGISTDEILSIVNSFKW